MGIASNKRTRKQATLLAAAIGAGALFTQMSEGATFTWDAGGGNTNWNTAGNWTGGANLAAGTAPSGSGYDVLIGTGGSSAVLNVNQTISGLTFNRANDFTISGTSNLTLNSITAAAPSSTARTYTISAALTLAQNNIWNVDSTTGATTLTVSSVISDGASIFGLTKEGGGVLVISGANTYDGSTVINGGVVEVDDLTGSSSSIGSAATAITLSGGTLRYVGGGETNSHGFTLGSNGGTFEANGTGGGANELIISGTMAASANTGSQTLALAGSNTDDNTISSAISNGSGTNVTHLLKAGSGRWTVSGNKSFTGATTISGGTLEIASLGNGGANSPIGASGSLSSNLILNGGALSYTGASVSTDRLFSVGTDSAGSTIEASGSGPINFTNPGAMGFNGQSGARTLTLSGSNTGNNTLAAAIGDNGGATSITKAGSGKWILIAANTYTGATTISGGTLAYGASNVLSDSSNVTIGSGTAVLDLGSNRSDTIGGLSLVAGTILGSTSSLTLNSGSYDIRTGTISTALSGSAGLTKTTSGTATITVAAGYTGATTISGGTLAITSMGNGGASSPIGASGSLSSNLVLNGGAISYTGASVSTDRLFSVGTDPAGSTIESSGSGSVNFTNPAAMGFNGQNGARTLTLRGSNSGSNTLAAIIGDNAGATSITKEGSSRWILTAANTYTGVTTVNNGTLQLSGGANRLSASSTLDVNAGTFDLNDNNQTVAAFSGDGGTVDLGSAVLTTGNATNTSYNGVIVGTGGITKQGSGTLSLGTSNNTYSGATTINEGILEITNIDDTGGSGIGNAANALVLNGGTLRYIGGSTSTTRIPSFGASGGSFQASGSGSLNLSGTTAMGFTGANGARTITLTGSSTAANTIAFLINNDAGDNATSVTKNSSGKWVITRGASLTANGYTGTTTINQGTLSLVSTAISNPIPSSAIISVQSGGTLDVTGITGGFKLGTGQTLRGTGAVVGTFIADAADSKIAPGNSPGRITFTGSGNITLSTATTYEVQIGGSGGGIGTAGTHFDQILVTGASKSITLGSAQLKILPMPGIVTGQAYRILSTASGSSVVASGIFKKLSQNLNAGGPYTDGLVTYNIAYGYGSGGYVDVTFSAVPEPTSLSVLALGACGLLQRRRRASKR